MRVVELSRIPTFSKFSPYSSEFLLLPIIFLVSPPSVDPSASALNRLEVVATYRGPMSWHSSHASLRPIYPLIFVS